MKIRLMDKASPGEKYRSIHGAQKWNVKKLLVPTSSEQGPVNLLCTSQILDVFTQLADWFTLYLSDFKKVSKLNCIENYDLVEKPKKTEWINAILSVTAQDENTVEFFGQAIAGGRLIAVINKFKFSHMSAMRETTAVQCRQVWENMQMTDDKERWQPLSKIILKGYWPMLFIFESSGFQFFAISEKRPSPRIVVIKNQAIVEIALGDIDSTPPFLIKHSNASFEEVDFSWRLAVQHQNYFLKMWKKFTSSI